MLSFFLKILLFAQTLNWAPGVPLITLIFGTSFIFRTWFLENKKTKLKIFSDEYDVLNKKLNEESRELKEISKFNSDLKNAIINISSSSALFQEIALIIPKDIQLLDFT